jgi:hypothetical protein
VLGFFNQQFFHGFTRLFYGDVDQLWDVIGDICIATKEQLVNESILQASITVLLVDVFEEDFNWGEYIMQNDVVNLVDLTLVRTSEVLLVFVLPKFYFVHAHFQQIAVCSVVVRHLNTLITIIHNAKY